MSESVPASKSALERLIDQAFDKVKDQQWFQQIQNSYQQLPAEKQQWVKWGSLITILFLFLYFTWNLMSDASQTKNVYFEKQELLQTVNQAGDEIRRLKGQNSGFSQAPNQNWKSVFQSLATFQKIPAENVDVLKETPGPAQTAIQETLLDVQVKGVGIRPLVQMLFQVEHGTPPMKLRALHVETQEKDGSLNAVLSVSGFSPKGEKK